MIPDWNWKGEKLLPPEWDWWTKSPMDSMEFAYWLDRYEPIGDEL